MDGIIQPVTAEFMVSAIDRADAGWSVAARLHSPDPRRAGRIHADHRQPHARLHEHPIAMFVAPGGARAASAGFILMLAADVAAMAPGTHMGAAHPVSIGGLGSEPKPDDTMSKKAASDMAAWARSLAEGRKRNVALAAEAVIESRAFTDREALDAKPPLIDVVSPDLADLLEKLDGRAVTRFDGRTVTLATTKARIVEVQMTRRQRLLSAIAASADCLPAAHAWHARPDRGVVEPWRHCTRRRRRPVPAAGLFRVSGAAREHWRACC